MPIKLRILLCVMLLEVVGYGLLLVYFVQSTGTALTRLRDVQVRGLFEANAARIDAETALIERAALDLASGGEVLLRTRAMAPDLDVEAWVTEYLTGYLSRTRFAVGLGLWYEPGALVPGRRLFGPYAFWNKQGVQLTWDLSSDAYDYLNQPWYLQGIPPDWPRARPRPEPIYWTEPYYDDAATQSLMMTVDAPFYAADGSLAGMATIDWSLEGMRTLVTQLRPTPGSRAFMIDSRSGRFVSFVLDDALTMQPATRLDWAATVVDEARRGDVLVRPAVRYGEVEYSVFATATQVGFVFGVMMPRADIEADIVALRNRNLVIGTVLSLAFIALVFATLRLMFRPFQELLGKIGASIRIDEADGHVSLTPVDYEARNEFAPIVRALNQVYAEVETYTRRLARANDDLRAQQAQIAALNASLEQRVAERTEHLVNLAEVGKELTASLDTERTFRRLYRRLHDSIDVRLLLIGVYDEAQRCVHVEFCMEEGERLIGPSLSLADSDHPAVLCIRERRPLVAWSAEELRHLVASQAPLATARPMETVVYLPLIVGERTVGCLSVQSPEPEAFNDSQLEFVRILASYTAIALDNAHSYARLKATLADLQRAQERLLVSEQSASAAALSPGAALELNNPTNFALAAAQNLQVALREFRDFLERLAGDDADPEVLSAFTLQFDEFNAQLEAILDGNRRIRDIVRDLRAGSEARRVPG